jgi:hypothetical protein
MEQAHEFLGRLCATGRTDGCTPECLTTGTPCRECGLGGQGAPVLAAILDATRIEADAAGYARGVREERKHIGHHMGSAFAAVLAERTRQDAKWGQRTHAWGIWLTILMEEIGEASEAMLDTPKDRDRVRAELVQVAAVAIAWIEAMDRARGGDGSGESDD